MQADKDKIYMRRCFQLARLGMGSVAPNPMVGCVIVHNDKIIGEGYHRKYGEAHAEVNALNSVKQKDLLKESTVYVSLEPCSHYGKTPPCAERLVNEGVKKVVICNLDPNPQVAGRGIKMLQDAGIEVECESLSAEGYELNKRFFTFFTQKRPFVTLKWAQTSDGFLDANNDKPIRISSDITKAYVHKMRAEEMAILVGTKTALKDNPKLHTRRWFGKNPLRLVIDKDLKIQADANLLDLSSEAVIFNGVKDDGKMYVKLDFSQNIIPQILDYLYKLNVQSLIVEGGKFTLDRFFESGLYDELHIEVGSYDCGEGTKAPQLIGNNRLVNVETIANSSIFTYKRF